jgi:hypothetical protein
MEGFIEWAGRAVAGRRDENAQDRLPEGNLISTEILSISSLLK